MAGITCMGFTRASAVLQRNHFSRGASAPARIYPEAPGPFELPADVIEIAVGDDLIFVVGDDRVGDIFVAQRIAHEDAQGELIPRHQRVLGARRQVARNGIAAFGDLRGQTIFRVFQQIIADQQNRNDDQQRNQQTELDF